jgi:hypothetical protein
MITQVFRGGVMDVPVLQNHDAANLLGRLSSDEDGRVRFVSLPDARLSEDEFFRIFPGAGVQFKGVDFERSERFIREALIFEFSLTPEKPSVLANDRLRLAVGRALGVADDVQFTNEQLVVAIERLAKAASQIPGVTLLSRDL